MDFDFCAGASVMAMQTHAMNMMAQAAPAKTTLRPRLASVALKVIVRTATDSRYTVEIIVIWDLI